ncbi:MAG TPA: hypothetical protein VGH21_05585, partial [Solirubrobacteraceae bacterium]
RSPKLIVLGSTDSENAEAIGQAVEELHAAYPEVPIVLGGVAVGGAQPPSRNGMRVLERIDEAVEAVEEQLAKRPQAASL